jgi:hypothetical protein
VYRLHARRQIDYAQASVPQAHVIIEIKPRLVRPAVAKDTYHILQNIRRNIAGTINMANTRYSTHTTPSQ